MSITSNSTWKVVNVNDCKKNKCWISAITTCLRNDGASSKIDQVSGLKFRVRYPNSSKSNETYVLKDNFSGCTESKYELKESWNLDYFALYTDPRNKDGKREPIKGMRWVHKNGSKKEYYNAPSQSQAKANGVDFYDSTGFKRSNYDKY